MKAAKNAGLGPCARPLLELPRSQSQSRAEVGG